MELIYKLRACQEATTRIGYIWIKILITYPLKKNESIVSHAKGKIHCISLTYGGSRTTKINGEVFQDNLMHLIMRTVRMVPEMMMVAMNAVKRLRKVCGFGFSLPKVFVCRVCRASAGSCVCDNGLGQKTTTAHTGCRWAERNIPTYRTIGLLSGTGILAVPPKCTRCVWQHALATTRGREHGRIGREAWVIGGVHRSTCSRDRDRSRMSWNSIHLGCTNTTWRVSIIVR